MDKKHTIWSNMDLNLDDWRDGLLDEYYDLNGEDAEEPDEYDLQRRMETLNDYYLDDERCNLDVYVNGVIVCIADLGLWDGRHAAFKVLGRNVKDILYDGDCVFCDWYADDEDIRFIGHHHDGTNEYLYRVFNGDEDELYEMTNEEMIARTSSLLPVVAGVYGWRIKESA